MAMTEPEGFPMSNDEAILAELKKLNLSIERLTKKNCGGEEDIVFAVPDDGTWGDLGAAGTTHFDFWEGKIYNTSGAENNIGNSLRSARHPTCQSLRIECMAPVAFWFENGSGKTPVNGNGSVTVAGTDFKDLYVESASALNKVRIFASTAPYGPEFSRDHRPDPAYTVETESYAIGATPVLIISESATIRKLLVKNTGTVVAYIGAADTVAAMADGYPLAAQDPLVGLPADEADLTGYSGDLWGWTAGAVGEVHVLAVLANYTT